RSWKRPTPGVFISECTNTVLENVKVHYAEGMGLLAQMSENITLDRFSVCLKGEDDPRFFTTQADATHFSACKGVIVSKNGLYEGMADDAINVHGTYLRVTKRLNDTTLQARYMHPQAWGFKWGETGDSVQFVESEKMERVGSHFNTITSIKAVDKPTEFGAKEFEITFAATLPQEISETGKFGIENLTWTPEVVFSDNIIRNNRARGALFSTPKRVICENNLFDHTHGTAILLCGDCNGWYETGACKEVIIRNNRFINALTATYQFTNAVISIYPEIPNLKDQQQFFHSGIVIENNTFETFDRPLVYAKSTDGLIFRNNTVTYNTEFEPFHWNKHPFFFERVSNVLIENNRFENGWDAEKDIR
ncbi:MAG TPA: alpha-1,3-galactosidase B, partial [Porphyromonadaceae bacterium]|nr:alpha-1,3-galactosidase B [Porphyromonadaceae bacterium]